MNKAGKFRNVELLGKESGASPVFLLTLKRSNSSSICLDKNLILKGDIISPSNESEIIGD